MTHQSTEDKNEHKITHNVEDRKKRNRSRTSAILEADEESTQLEAHRQQFLLSPTVTASELNGAVTDGERLVEPQQHATRHPTNTARDKAVEFVQEQVGQHVAHLRNVFATPLSVFGSSPLPHHAKTPEEIMFMSHHLRSNYLFETLPHQDMIALIGAFEKVVITADQIAQDPAAAVLIREGDVVNRQTAYFYLLYHGTCSFTVHDKVVGVARPGDSFGELALLYNCPRAATVVAVVDSEDDAGQTMADPGAQFISGSITSTTATFTPAGSAASAEPTSSIDHSTLRGVVLFRVHQRTFRRILQQADQSADEVKLKLLDSVDFLKDVSRMQKQKLAAAMKPRPFKKAEYLMHKGERKCSWTIIERGSVLATNISVLRDDEDSSAESKYGGYEDVLLREGNCFGQRAISTGTPTVADLIAETDGIAFEVDRETFLEVLGNLKDVIHRALDDAKLQAIQIIINTTQKDERMHGYLASKIEDMLIPEGTVICREGKPMEMDAALYLVRTGEIKISSTTDEDVIIGMDGYFGEDQLKSDTVGRAKFISKYTAVAITECVCGVLKLESFRRIIDTQNMGKPQNINELDSLRICDVTVTLDQLKLSRILGAGTFGQVWLVSRTASDGTLRAYALKVQSKHELCTSGQARGVVREKNIMSQFHNPFVAGLVSSFQDEERVYMLMNLVQGGELHSIMHSSRSDVLSESDSRFYIACIAEGLSYMHRHLFVYRDLKPEVCFRCFRCYTTTVLCLTCFSCFDAERFDRQQRVRTLFT